MLNTFYSPYYNTFIWTVLTLVIALLWQILHVEESRREKWIEASWSWRKLWASNIYSLWIAYLEVEERTREGWVKESWGAWAMIITCAAPRPAPSVAGAEQESIVCSSVTCTAAMHVLCIMCCIQYKYSSYLRYITLANFLRGWGIE